jgi:hypothetical protein
MPTVKVFDSLVPRVDWQSESACFILVFNKLIGLTFYVEALVPSHNSRIMSDGIPIRRVGFERICAIFCRLLKGKDIMLISNNGSYNLLHLLKCFTTSGMPNTSKQ